MTDFDASLQVFDTAFTSSKTYADPIRDVTLSVRFVSPGGDSQEIEGFWDGDHTWRVRFAASEAGDWHYETLCSDTDNQGIHGRRGIFHVQTYTGENPLLRRGPIHVSANRRHLIHEDGTPFFWLADTAWNGLLKATSEDWHTYLQIRRQQGFTAVQAVLTHWRAFDADAAGERAFAGRAGVQINPSFYQRLDEKVAAVAAHGLVPALVLIWACTPTDPGYYLAADDLAALARYEVARYGAYRAVWLLGGDGEYRGEHAQKWIEAGRQVFGDGSDHVVTMHPRGTNWPNEAFRSKPWFSFASYQSGHGDDQETLRWLTQGPPATNWDNQPHLPVINQEPNYEHHVSYHRRQVFGAHQVRRALYWSLLVSPTAGVTYGHHGIWPWMTERGIPMDHERSGEAPPWWEALESEGARSVTHLRAFFEGMDWWRLRPAQEMLVQQPGDENAENFIAIARSDDDTFVVAYTPAGRAIVLDPESVASFGQLRWYNPRSGVWQAAQADRVGRFVPSQETDWVLLLQR